MNSSNVGLAEMLEAREKRAFLQQKLIAQYSVPIVCLSMNIAGPIKRTPFIRFLFNEGVKLFENAYPRFIDKIIIDEATGCEALWAINYDPESIKKETTAIETLFPAARLYDFDVLQSSGEKLSRSSPRSCIICGMPVQGCARSRAHGLDAVISKTNQILYEFTADCFANYAYESLIEEVHFTPKPGLVDESNNGSHKDMDLSMFEKSAVSLIPYFSKCFMHGVSMGSMSQLRSLGIAAEKTMFSVTGGVNTHKGAIFSIGLLLSGIGLSFIKGNSPFDNVRFLLESEQCPDTSSTNGGVVRKKYGQIGAYEEALSGFPLARKSAELYEKLKSKNNLTAKATVLCTLMSEVEDTNMYHRGGKDGISYMRDASRKILALPNEQKINALAELDNRFIERNLSPGGCADMLALCFFIDKWAAACKDLF